MNKSKQELIETMNVWPRRAEEWKQVSEDKWRKPLEPGKWSAAEAVAHLLKWDEYFLERAVRPAVEQGLITLENTDFNDFNQKAAAYGTTTEPRKLLEEAIAAREGILTLLDRLPDELFLPEQGYLDEAGHRFDIEEYIVDFASHDHHHMSQIEASLNRAEE
ncbi:DinB family protein [Gorillibacterium timonense]|uniref:DinB family protein n=1 Tax=Gorillibacterium timonense TaxID=1689269 RepID=UPI00071D265B|nr:DinB family protein [Gorillibacterium timonense]